MADRQVRGREVCGRESKGRVHMQLLQQHAVSLERQLQFRPRIPVILVAVQIEQRGLQTPSRLLVAAPT